MSKRFISLFLGLALVCAAGASAASYPPSRGRVNDTAGILDARSQAALTGLLTELDRKADAQVVVAIVKDLSDEDIGSYATGLYKAWGIGKKGVDRGALILVSVGDKKARIEPGYA